MPGPSKAISTSTLNPNDRLTNHLSASIKLSWQALIAMSQTVEDLAANSQWREITQIVIDRRKFMDWHFAQYPIGPSTENFYRHKLNWLFEAENRIEQLAKTAREISFRH